MFPWLDEYLHELSVFPRGKHDDQADSTAQFLDWFKTPMPHWGIFEYTRQEAEKLKNPIKRQVVEMTLAPGSVEWFESLKKSQA